MSVEVKQFSKVLGEFKEDITNQEITLMKQMICESREDTNKNLVVIKKDATHECPVQKRMEVHKNVTKENPRG